MKLSKNERRCRPWNRMLFFVWKI